MPFLIVPNEVFGNDATIWVAAIDEPLDPATTILEFGSNQKPLNSGWIDFQTADQTRRIRYQRVTLNNLSPRTKYSLALRVGGVVRADGSMTTIPHHLPLANERAFTVLLGSCYYGRDDPNGLVGQTYLQMPTDARPDIKFLVGDQVYLDNPFHHFLNPFSSKEWLETRSFGVYANTWSHSTNFGGFNQLLKHNANFFTSDDHEFWNNAPDIGLNVPLITASKKRRDQWWQIAHELYKIFQTNPGFAVKFKVNPLSFCIAETRFSRGSGRDGVGDFMLPAVLDDIGTWAASLDGPGVLVLGQPFFEDTGSIKDYGLPDFKKQYQQLKDFLRAANHSIVILTGDVHYARISVANLRPELGTRLYEVISSPMQLVGGGGAKYKPAPHVFGSVFSQPEFSFKRNHFLTLEFSSPSAQRASMVVKFWPIIDFGGLPQSQVIGGPIELI